MLRLHWKKIVSLFCFLLLLTNAFSQNKMKYQAAYDAKKMRFGYLVGISSTNYNVKHNRSFLAQTSYLSINSPSTYHVRMGGIVNFSLNSFFDFRVLPTVSIYSRILTVDTVNLKQNDKAWFEIPVMLKYKSERRGNVRMYMFGGMRFGMETNVISFRNRRGTASPLSTKNKDFSVEYGLGLELFREYFKFAPELHFSHGLANMVEPVISGTSPLGRIEKLRTHTVTLFFNFE